ARTGSAAFGTALHVIEDAAMDAVDERVRPKIPVELREQIVAIPGASLEPRPTGPERDETELPVLGLEPADQVGRVHVLIRAPLWDGGGLRANVEAEPSGWVPDRDRLDEWSGRELACADRADTRATDARAEGIGDAEAEDELARRRQLRDTDDVRPHRRQWRVDLDAGDHFA